MAQYTLKQLADMTIAKQSRRKARRSERRRARDPEEFYAELYHQVTKDNSPCCAEARTSFAGVESLEGLENVVMEVDPENLDKVLEFLKYVLEMVLPIILSLLGLSIMFCLLSISIGG